MNLSNLANLGEFVAGIGVVISLLYLSVQIRQNTAWVRASTHQSFADSVGNTLEGLYSDPELYEFFRKGLRSPEKLTEEERLRWHMISTRIVRLMESAYYQHASGTMDPEWWQAIGTSWQEWMSEPGLALWLKQNEYRLVPAVSRWLKAASSSSPSDAAAPPSAFPVVGGES